MPSISLSLYLITMVFNKKLKEVIYVLMYIGATQESIQYCTPQDHGSLYFIIFIFRVWTSLFKYLCPLSAGKKVFMPLYTYYLLYFMYDISYKFFILSYLFILLNISYKLTLVTLQNYSFSHTLRQDNVLAHVLTKKVRFSFPL